MVGIGALEGVRPGGETLNVLILARCITRGGASRVLLRSARGLAERGHQVVLALTQGGVVEDGIAPSVPVHRFPRRRPLPGIGRLQNMFRGRLLKRWLDRIERELKPDVLYSVDLAEEVLDLAAGSKVPCVEHIHALHLDTMTRPISYLRKLSSVGDAYIVPSKFLQERLRDCLGVPHEDICVFPGGIPVADLKRRAERLDRGEVLEAVGLGTDDAVVVGCGGVNFVKGVDRFIRAAALTREQLPADLRVKFVWIGERYGPSSPIWNACVSLIEQLELQDTVRFVGYRDDPVPLFAMADLMAVTSRAESLSLVALEALAVGTPVVAFPTGGVPETLSSGGGVLVPDDDVESLARVLARLLTDRDEREKLAREGRRAVASRFDAGQLLPELEAILWNVARTHGSRWRTGWNAHDPGGAG